MQDRLKIKYSLGKQDSHKSENEDGLYSGLFIVMILGKIDVLNQILLKISVAYQEATWLLNLRSTLKYTRVYLENMFNELWY